MKTINVHMKHCCYKHGCKYGDEDCPVQLGIQKQSFPCESCGWDLKEAEENAEYYFSLLTNEQRLEIIASCCKFCGTLNSVNSNCQCWNDE